MFVDLGTQILEPLLTFDMLLLLFDRSLDLPKLRKAHGFLELTDTFVKLIPQEPQAWVVVSTNAAEKLNICPDA